MEVTDRGLECWCGTIKTATIETITAGHTVVGDTKLSMARHIKAMRKVQQWWFGNLPCDTGCDLFQLAIAFALAKHKEEELK